MAHPLAEWFDSLVRESDYEKSKKCYCWWCKFKQWWADAFPLALFIGALTLIASGLVLAGFLWGRM